MASDTPVHRPTVPVSMPRCPICGVELQLGSSGALDRWSCTAGHGLAMTLSESYEQLQEDEIGRLWQLARDAAEGPLLSPFDGLPMRRFSLPFDADEAARGRARRRPRHRLGGDRRRRREPVRLVRRR